MGRVNKASRLRTRVDQVWRSGDNLRLWCALKRYRSTGVG